VDGAEARFPAEFLAELRRRTDIVALIGQRVALRPAGRELVGLCPFHEERTPSFYVSPERQLYHCHGCHAGGDAIEFLRRAGGLGFAEAVEELAARAGLPVPAGPALGEGERRRLQELEAMRAALSAAAAFFRDALLRPEGRDAIAYLRARGVDGPTAERFGLGYAPSDWEALGRALGGRFPPEVLAAAGLRATRGQGRPGAYDRFRHRIMFPIADERGRIVGFGGRALDPAERAKYLNSPETRLFRKREVLYGLDLARAAIGNRGRVLVVEGYMDALTCHQFGFGEAVAALGTSLSAEQAGTIARLTECALLAFDADTAGEAAAERAGGLGLLQERGVRVEVAALPEGQDPDDVLRGQDGRRRFETALSAAAPLVHHLVRRAIGPEGVAGQSPERRWQVVRRLLPVLRRCDAGVRAEYTEWVARTLLLSPTEVRRAVEAAPGGREHRNSKDWNHSRVKEPAGRAKLRSGADAAEEMVLAACLQSAEHLRRWLADLSIHDFRQAPHRALFERLSGWAEVAAAAGGAPEGPEEAPGVALLDRTADEGERALLGRLLGADLGSVDGVVLGQCVGRMRRARREEELLRWRERERELAAAGHGLESAERRATLQRISELTAELAGFARGGSDG
jgi:DNA primase